MSGHGKGSGFERDICKLLGLWWTGGLRDDIFWRSSTSGARAKVRSGRGQSTFGQYGDIQATDPVGQPLVDLFTIELKCGYGHASIADVLDKKETSATQAWEHWLAQAMQDRMNSDRPFWMLITRRDRRETVVFMPWNGYRSLCRAGAALTDSLPHFRFKVGALPLEHVFATTLSEFIRHTHPDNIVTAAKEKQ